MENRMRKTKIICTIGPASESEERLKELMLAGMNVARFNFSHGTHEEQKAKFERVLKVREELKLPVATMLDTKGPEIRLRDFEGGKAELVAGQTFILTTEEMMGTAEKATISYKNLKNDITVGTTILIDDGLIEMQVTDIKGEEIICNVINGGFVSNHKGVNVPGAILSMPYISEVDKADIVFAGAYGIAHKAYRKCNTQHCSNQSVFHLLFPSPFCSISYSIVNSFFIIAAHSALVALPFGSSIGLPSAPFPLPDTIPWLAAH